MEYIFYILGIVLTVWALLDCAKSTLKRDKKILWLIIILLLFIIGPVLWILIGRKR